MTRDQPDTYFARAQVDADAEAGGRWAKLTPTRITGAAPAPPLPTPNWSHDPVPPEPPLGVDINAVPDLGFGHLSEPQAPASRAAADAVETGPLVPSIRRRRL